MIFILVWYLYTPLCSILTLCYAITCSVSWCQYTKKTLEYCNSFQVPQHQLKHTWLQCNWSTYIHKLIYLGQDLDKGCSQIYRNICIRNLLDYSFTAMLKHSQYMETLQKVQYAVYYGNIFFNLMDINITALTLVSRVILIYTPTKW